MTLKEGRDRVIYWLREDGEKLKEIGKLFFISSERVRQIYYRERFRREWERRYGLQR